MESLGLINIELAIIRSQLEDVGRKLDVVLENQRPKRIPGDRPVVSTDVRLVYEHWVGVMGKNPKTTKLTPERRRCIQARLKEGYEVADLLLAIDGCKASDFHMARGQWRGGTKYNDLTLILRNGSKLEGFRDGKAQENGGAFL